jgi:hypothetical protein
MYAQQHACIPPAPPTPLILAGWAHSNDVEKMLRWEETVAWAIDNGCAEVVRAIPDEDFYFVDEPSTYAVGPLGRPMCRPWDFDSKGCPSSEEIDQHLDTLRSHWSEIVGHELAIVTRPFKFTGAKARRLLVQADGTARPAWGGWAHLSLLETERRAFTRFRGAINSAIAPHEVDHVDFTTDAEPVVPGEAPQATRP